MRGNFERIVGGNGERNSHRQRGDFLKPWAAADALSSGGTVRETRAAPEVDDAAVQKGPRCDEEHDQQHVGRDCGCSQSVAHGKGRGIERVAII